MINEEWLFKEPVDNKIDNKNNPKSLKQLAREKIKLDDKKLAENKINPSYVTDGNLKVEFKIKLDTNKKNHGKSKLTIPPNYHVFGIEVRYINKIIREFSVNYARLINQNKFEYKTVFFSKI